MTYDIRPFEIFATDEGLADLRDRLARTRWPEAETVSDWSQGMPLAYTRELCDYWARDYDWRAAERHLNSFPQYVTTIDDLDIHFLHVRSPEPEALPLLITHGWPGSVVEFLKVIGPLTDPVAHGGRAEDAFHVVCPSLPGFAFSGKPRAAGWGVPKIATVWAQLMARLGYERYGAQGGDWGSSITTALGRHDPAHLAGIHLTMPMVPLAGLDFSDATETEQAALAAMGHYQEWESGYSKQQSTRPQSVGYGLVDSPVGQCAWIVEKFWAWTDCDGHPENVITRDELLTNVMLYWITASGASSARLYWESFAKMAGASDGPVTVPTGCSIFPKEIFRISERWARTGFSDLRYFRELDRGGHFAALEQPELFVGELRNFFALVR